MVARKNKAERADEAKMTQMKRIKPHHRRGEELG
jgi:hypothetical protein